MSNKKRTNEFFNSKRKIFKPLDLIIAGLVLFSAIFIAIYYFGIFNQTSLVAVISINGKETQKINLSDVKAPYKITVNGELDVELLIEKDGVTFVSSPCPDKVCIHTGKIKYANQSAVCLPAKVSVSLIKNNQNKNDIDAVVG